MNKYLIYIRCTTRITVSDHSFYLSQEEKGDYKKKNLYRPGKDVCDYTQRNLLVCYEGLRHSCLLRLQTGSHLNLSPLTI